MTDEIKKIVLDFEASLLDGVREGADEAGLRKIGDAAFDRLREIKESLRLAGQLESFFDAALEIMAKLDMALKVVKP